MLKGLWLCLKTFPKPELVVFACVAVLVIAFGKAVDNYVTDKAVEVYETMHSVSKESLEIVLCPMPRVYGLRLTHFGESLPRFFNKLLFDGLVTPFMADHENKLRKKYHSIFSGHLKDGTLKCLEKQKSFKPTDPLPFLISQMANFGVCQVKPVVFMPLFRALEDGITIKRFLDKYFGTLDEMLLEEYPGLLDQAWVLPYDNLTIEQMLDYVGVNLKRYIDEDMLRKSVQDIAGPSQTLEESLVDTRMAPNCFRHLFRHNENQGHQRSKIVYQFRKSCPKEPEETLISKSPCLETADMYITMYITAYNQFTDVPAASVIVPYRVAADENTLVHVSAIKRIHKKQCKHYGQEESQVTCIEDCLYEKLTPDNQTASDQDAGAGKMQCRVPWIDRLKQRSNRTVSLPLCHTKEELKTTIRTIRDMFDIREASDCSRRCPRHCHQLSITPRLAGSARTPPGRAARIPRHPRLEVLISDALPVFSETQQYDFGKMIAEMLGNLSFLVGVSLVALYDWLIGLVLWMFGKLPFIPAMPPLIKDEIYMSEACSCAETEEERRQSIKDTMDEDETFLAASFRHHRRASMLRSFNPHDDGHSRRRRAMTLNQFPVMAVNSSAMDTVARTFPREERSTDRCSIDGSRSRTEDWKRERVGSRTLSGPGSGARHLSVGASVSAHSDTSVLPPLAEIPSQAPSVTVQPAPVESAAADGISAPSAVGQPATSRTVVPPAAERPSGVLRRCSSRQVAPAASGQTAEQQEQEPRSAVLPSLAAAPPERPRATVRFDMDDVDRILGPTVSARQQVADDPGSRPQPEPAVQRDRSAAPQYRSRPIRRRPTRPPDSSSPDKR